MGFSTRTSVSRLVSDFTIRHSYTLNSCRIHLPTVTYVVLICYIEVVGDTLTVTCVSKQMSRAVIAESCADSSGIFNKNVLDCASQRVPFGSVPSALSKLGRFCTISRKFIYFLLTKQVA